ncbi:MAG: NGG1p interacting factor NIF3 [Deltaproteobacteria bacterium]|nr:NGG1p interacting factor NIF3 [Deltaproteobacteria bacterium]
MRIRDFYERAVKYGIEADPRGVDEVGEDLKRSKKDYESLKDKEKDFFDNERFTNPYADTRILFGDEEKEIKRILLGIDMEVGEVLLADRLAERGTPVDLIVAHHPEGRAMAELHDVMDMQAGILLKQGVPIHVAENLMAERVKEVERRLRPVNHTRSVDAARLLNIPFMCMHTPSDNLVTTYLQDLIEKENPRYTSEVLDILNAIPEYEDARKEAVAPSMTVGTKERRVGKVFVDMTGGTGGSKKIFDSLSTAGVGTVVGMHISEEHRKEAQKHHINVILAGHISSDTLGLNLLLDKIIDDNTEVLACSGFRRITAKEREKRS